LAEKFERAKREITALAAESVAKLRGNVLEEFRWCAGAARLLGDAMGLTHEEVERLADQCEDYIVQKMKERPA